MSDCYWRIMFYPPSGVPVEGVAQTLAGAVTHFTEQANRRRTEHLADESAIRAALEGLPREQSS